MQWGCDSGSQLKAVHVCACTYMHAAQGPALKDQLLMNLQMNSCTTEM